MKVKVMVEEIVRKEFTLVVSDDLNNSVGGNGFRKVVQQAYRDGDIAKEPGAVVDKSFLVRKPDGELVGWEHF